MNTVHVVDVSRAVVHLLTNLPLGNSAQIYHVVDESLSTQGTVCDAIAEIFGIQVNHVGTLLSTVAKVGVLPMLTFSYLIGYIYI